MTTQTAQTAPVPLASPHAPLAFAAAAEAAVDRLCELIADAETEIGSALDVLYDLLDGPLEAAPAGVREAFSALYDQGLEAFSALTLDGSKARAALAAIPAGAAIIKPAPLTSPDPALNLDVQAAGIAMRIVSPPVGRPEAVTPLEVVAPAPPVEAVTPAEIPCPMCDRVLPLGGSTGLCGQCSAKNGHRPYVPPVEAAPVEVVAPAPAPAPLVVAPAEVPYVAPVVEVGECFKCQSAAPLVTTADGWDELCEPCAAEHDGEVAARAKAEAAPVEIIEAAPVVEAVALVPLVAPTPPAWDGTAPVGGWDAMSAYKAALEEYEAAQAEITASQAVAEATLSASQDATPGQRKLLIVIGCTNAKLAGAHEARDLYMAADTFRARRHYAEQRSQEPDTAWAVLSAKHGILWQDERITPYNETIRGIGGPGRAKLVTSIRARLETLDPSLDTLEIECLCGSEYRQVIERAVKGSKAIVRADPDIVDSNGKTNTRAPWVREWAKRGGFAWTLKTPQEGALWPALPGSGSEVNPANTTIEVPPAVCTECCCAPCACSDASEAPTHEAARQDPAATVQVPPTVHEFKGRGAAIAKVEEWTGSRPSFPKSGGTSADGAWTLTKVKKGLYTVEATLCTERVVTETEAEERALAAVVREEDQHAVDVDALRGTQRSRYDGLVIAMAALISICPRRRVNSTAPRPSIVTPPMGWAGADAWCDIHTMLSAALDKLVPVGKTAKADPCAAGASIIVAYAQARAAARLVKAFSRVADHIAGVFPEHARLIDAASIG